jgi:hypothetical protein
MPMTKEERKEYNKKYYEINRAQMLEKYAKKEPCEICGKMLSHQNVLTKHKKSKQCIRAGKLKEKSMTIDKETYDKLMKLIESKEI